MLKNVVAIARAILAARGAAVAAMALAGAICMPSTAAAVDNSTFGTRYEVTERYGSRVAITAPPNTFFQAGDEFTLHRAVVQSGDPPKAGLVQAGLIRGGYAFGFDGCGVGNGQQYRYIEIKEYADPVYNCAIFYSAGAVSPGTTLTFDVFRHSPSGYWGAYINGIDRGTFSLGFNTGSGMIGGEINGADAYHASGTAATYGGCCMSWSTYRGVPRSNPVQVSAITTTGLLTPSTGWTVGRAPTPLISSHPAP